jgi:glycosyltransferase involved in cell wall biosynthesis
MEMTVCVATYGGLGWRVLAERAVASAQDQARVIAYHGQTLAQARNVCLAKASTPYVIFLDADDELEPGYVKEMQQGTADIRAPLVRAIFGRRSIRPRAWKVMFHSHKCSGDCLPDGNWLPIGCAARTKLLRSVGGFDEYPLYEDWAIWLKCWKAGASFEQLKGPIYRAYRNDDSRNRSGEAYLNRKQWHNKIVADIIGAPA